MAVVNLKKQDFDKCIEYCDGCLEVDHKHAKALFLKGRALCFKTEFKAAISVFEDLLLFDPDNKEGQIEL